ncbi:SDR family oxidoreductase [Amycolatopsis aidingensis]|uniref:SDR family oxidoreductase n=1 Tax=Amycolatopsis aidingensis TaxID=2842453 RepID=UPI001C0DD6EE|nr:SDR family oxidoreductase [Amycolatopsis aidingensis]
MGNADGARTVVVTGASAGIGRATARLLGARGDRVALLARGERGLREVTAEIRAAGGVPLPIPVDVADYDAVRSVAARVAEEFGPIDVWINGAFATAFGPFTEIEPAEFHRVTATTYHGFVHGTRAALEQMRPRGRGAIVQIGSALAHRGVPLQSAYCGAKHAIQGFTESLRCELLHERSGVAVTMVHLPAVNTPQFEWALSRMPRRPQPIPPIYQPEVAARAVLHAADHPRRRGYWVGFSTVGTMLGNRVAGGLLDRYLARTAYRAQQDQAAEDPDRPANLWHPADAGGAADFGARGRFSARSRDRSPQLWLSQHHGILTAGLLGAAAGLAATARRLRPARKERS